MPYDDLLSLYDTWSILNVKNFEKETYQEHLVKLLGYATQFARPEHVLVQTISFLLPWPDKSVFFESADPFLRRWPRKLHLLNDSCTFDLLFDQKSSIERISIRAMGVRRQINWDSFQVGVKSIGQATVDTIDYLHLYSKMDVANHFLEKDWRSLLQCNSNTLRQIMSQDSFLFRNTELSRARAVRSLMHHNFALLMSARLKGHRLFGKLPRDVLLYLLNTFCDARDWKSCASELRWVTYGTWIQDVYVQICKLKERGYVSAMYEDLKRHKREVWPEAVALDEQLHSLKSQFKFKY